MKIGLLYRYSISLIFGTILLYDLVAGFHVRSEFGQCLLNHAGDMVRREKKKKQSNRRKKKVQAKNLLKSKLVIIFVSLVLKNSKLDC